MFDLLNGGDERVSFLIEYLVVKGVVTKEAATWLKRAGGAGIKTDFFFKSDNKPEVVKMMDSVDYDSYSRIVNNHLVCKKCSGKVSIHQGSTFTAAFNCEKCGIVGDKKLVLIDDEAVKEEIKAKALVPQV